METTATRPAIDVGPAEPRPVLAFVLALLAVPGSTWAWDLPAGGLWIGLPLCLAAIYLGLRARRQGARVGLATASVVIAGLALAQMVVWTTISVVS
jgi:hypothetical protein